MTDEQLMKQVQQGDLQPMSLLFERHYENIFRYFMTCTNSEFESKDLVQSVFERVMKYSKSFNTSRKFKVWLFGIAVNVWKDESHKKSKQQKEQIAYSSIAETIQLPDEELITRNETIDQANTALEQLPEEARQLIWLNWNQQLRYKEIAHIMSSTEGAIRVKIHRAIKRLRLEYQKLQVQ